MKVKIIHETVYRFSSEVFLEPHYLRFKPKTTPHQALESFSLKLSPAPAGIAEQTDAENNLVHYCWFVGMNEELSIRAESLLDARAFNPLNFVLYPSHFSDLPFVYSEEQRHLLQAALQGVELSQDLIEYGERIKQVSNFNTLSFITNLTRQIHADFTIESRETGEPYAPDQSFELKIGSCRDLAWMQIHLFRYMGIAARFVSGYYYIELENPNYELHAWVEVFLPGAGWVGLDPTNGIVTANAHLPIATSVHYENTMPVTGIIRGDGISILKTNLVIEVVG